MSIMIMSRLFRMNLGGCNRKLLAVRLADFADDEGRGIYPGVRRLATETELSERTIQRILSDFVTEGILVVVKEATGRPGQTTRYDFNLGRLFSHTPGKTGDTVSPVVEASTGDNPAERGDTDDGEGCHGVTRTVIEPPIEPSYEKERASAGSDGSEGEENPKALERRLRKWWANWPTYGVDDEGKTRRAWLSLTPDQRKACEEKTPDYLDAMKASGRTFSKAASTYLRERTWERLADKPEIARVASAERHNPYSRPWAALRLAELSKHPLPLTLTPLENSIIDAKPEKESIIWRDKREKAGWPEAVKLNEAARERRPVIVPPHIVAISTTFDKVEVGGPIWEAWKRLHQDRCWPWMPEPNGLPFVQFPALPDGIDDPDEAVSQALKAFQRKLIERDEDDAA